MDQLQHFIRQTRISCLTSPLDFSHLYMSILSFVNINRNFEVFMLFFFLNRALFLCSPVRVIRSIS